ncbi:MAG: hypothetical protein ABIK26_02775 [Candidatus Omnitrophota bacterium]|nr:hypothetical protein [Candidatus Omnitrophota bacterium]MBU1523288.1 hypothetical protein [Candidatus Omnitrophota bacterium]MBU2436806.1 hypothetical protein [Candidatus Omnitrophota bacterium]
MERAIFITKPNQLKYVDGKYSRLYYGREFCERLIPSSDELDGILSFVRKNKLDFSLVAPYVTNAGLKKLQVLLELLKAKTVNCEIIVNDWGVLNLVNCKYPNLMPVLGRLLTKQKRGPRLAKLLNRDACPRLIQNPQNPKQRILIFTKKLPLDLDPYYKGSNASSVPIIHNFLISRGVRRIELDNTAHGIRLELPKGKISASVYFPYVYISTTFFCPTAGCDEKNKSFLKIKSCKRQCQRYTFKMRHKTIPKLIYLKGNTQFYKNPRISVKELERLGVNRIVYQPEIPV